jgi:hypothetical protein
MHSGQTLVWAAGLFTWVSSKLGKLQTLPRQKDLMKLGDKFLQVKFIFITEVWS